MEDIVKSRKLKDLLSELAYNGVVDADLSLTNLEEIYSSGYRHFYSDILMSLKDMSPESRDYLTLSLDELSEKVKCRSSEKTKSSFKKLNDHVMLETTRMNTFMTKADTKVIAVENSIVKANEAIDELDKKIKGFNKKNEKIDSIGKKVDEFNTQSVTVLSIFTGIVMTFFGGMSLFGEVFKAIDKVGEETLIIMASIVGFIMFNSIFALITLVAKIVGKDIRSKSLCENSNCICDKKCWAINRFRKKHPMSFYPNVIIIVLIIFAIFKTANPLGVFFEQETFRLVCEIFI